MQEEQIEEVPEVEPPSMEDTVASILKKQKEAAPAAEETESLDAAPPAPDKTEPARDEKGRFAKTESGTPSDPAKPPANPQEAPQAASPAKPAFIPKWKKEALEKWALLDPLVKGEVERREQDFHKGIEQYKSNAEAAQAWQQAVSPYLATIQSFGVQPHQAAQALFATDHALRYGTPAQKWQMLQKIAQDYGITPVESASGQPEQSSQQNPEVQALYQRLAQLEGHLNQAQTMQQQAQMADLNTQIQKFAADPARAEYFETLRPSMAALLQTGQADSLESAFEQAYKLHPVTSQLWIAKQQEEWRKQGTQKAAEAKKAAAVNVRSKGNATGPAGATQGSMQDTIRAKARELGLVN